MALLGRTAEISAAETTGPISYNILESEYSFTYRTKALSIEILRMLWDGGYGEWRNLERLSVDKWT